MQLRMSFVESPLLLTDTSPLATGAWPAAPHCTPSAALHIHGPKGAARRDVQRFISGIYTRHYGARVASFMPQLVSLQEEKRLCAAAGYRSAREALFLERYLPQPIERVISAAAGMRIRRDEIVEVGHFASARAGAGRRLMVALGRHLADEGFRWVVLTATAELRAILRRMGLVALTLADADRRHLGADAAAWGSYYAHAPQVLAGDLVSALVCFDRRSTE